MKVEQPNIKSFKSIECYEYRAGLLLINIILRQTQYYEVHEKQQQHQAKQMLEKYFSISSDFYKSLGIYTWITPF